MKTITSTIFVCLIFAILACALLLCLGFSQQMLRFFSFRDGSVQVAILGCSLLGLNSGLLGSFIVVRRMSLLGDALSHAVLPGIVLGFIYASSKDLYILFAGAVLAGIISVSVMFAIKRTTRIREDSILVMILSGFYAIGVCLLTMLQGIDIPGKSGLNSYLLGQASAMSGQDIQLLAICSIVSIALITGFYRWLLALSFDEAFARSIKIPVAFVNYFLYFILSFSIVASLQAVGVVLIVALLILPAATAFLMVNRMHIMALLSAFFGLFSAFFGGFISFLGPKIPTGPVIVLVSGCVFLTVLLFNPGKGLIFEAIYWKRRRNKVQAENILKRIYKHMELKDLGDNNICTTELSDAWHLSEKELMKDLRLIISLKWAHMSAKTRIELTSLGNKKAKTIVRNHRLWETYLTQAANYPADHVHDDAEKMEHLITEGMASDLEKRLNSPTKDPHGKDIPRL